MKARAFDEVFHERRPLDPIAVESTGIVFVLEPGLTCLLRWSLEDQPRWRTGDFGLVTTSPSCRDVQSQFPLQGCVLHLARNTAKEKHPDIPVEMGRRDHVAYRAQCVYR